MTQCWSHLGKTAPRELTELGGASFCPSVFCPHFAYDGWRLRSHGRSYGNLKDRRHALGWWSRKAEARVPSDVTEALASLGLLVSSLFYLRKKQIVIKSLLLFLFLNHMQLNQILSKSMLVHHLPAPTTNCGAFSRQHNAKQLPPTSKGWSTPWWQVWKWPPLSLLLFIITVTFGIHNTKIMISKLTWLFDFPRILEPATFFKSYHQYQI